MRLTRRGAVVLGFALVLLGFGQWGGYPLLRALGLVMLGAVAAAVALTARKIDVGVHRVVYPDRVERGKPALARLQVSNPGSRRQPSMFATDGTSQEIHIRSLLPGAHAEYHYELPTHARGKLTVGPLTLYRVDPFGLATNRLPTGETGTLWVHPRQYPARALVGGHPRHHHEGATTDDTLRGSVELQDVREYQPGDEVRHMHWKATARTGRLMVRDLIDPQQPRFTVLVDTRPDSLPAATFEEAVDLAASLVAASARAGHHSRLVTSSGIDLPTPGGPQAARILLDELAQIDQTGDANSVVPGVLSASRGVGGCLVLVTAAQAELTSLAWLRHRFSAIFLVVLGESEERAAVSGARVLGARDAVHAVHAWNEVAR
ncbi:MAG: DUF58 domain-containing protein [Kibdelosporangium sp.]